MSHKPYNVPPRRYFYSNKVAANNLDYGQKEDIQVVEAEQANLISSYVEHQDPWLTGTPNAEHAPVIDFDIPIEVIPSTQLGHYHLYIHKKIPWHKYVKLLQELKNCRFVETGFVNASVSKGFTAVRPIGVVKPNPPRGSSVLIENAKLRRENFNLKQRISELEAQVQNDNTIKTSTEAPAQV